jgi:glycosyltransferase involved in cell wall biosynthesis
MATIESIRVVYDYQIFGRQRYGGISRYFCELAKCVASDESFDVKILAGLYINEYLCTVPSNLIGGLKVPQIPKTGTIIEQINVAFSKLWLQNHSTNIVHETFYASQSLAPSHARRVLTIYDMIDEKFYPDSGVNKLKEMAVRRADHIICISESTKKDLLSLMSIDPDKVSVIHLAHSPGSDFSDQKLHKQPVDAPYILYVGDRYGYKNFSGLIQAYANSEQLKKDFKLVCFGAPPLSSEELSWSRQLGIAEGNLLHFAGSDALLKQFYQGASAFVYPSMYEGFGIPPLEAMSLSCPVICSNTSSIPEVVGNAAELFDPNQVESITVAMEKVLYSAEYSEQLKSLGHERIKSFSWEKCAKQTQGVYLSLL